VLWLCNRRRANQRFLIEMMHACTGVVCNRAESPMVAPWTIAQLREKALDL
jgi:hypothetical protein